jgi:ABC-2 type transport system permease protein
VNGYLVFTRKEVSEIIHTWRIWVLPAIMLFFAVTAPVIARFTPEIVGAVGGAGLGQLALPTPTYLDAYGGWIKNLSQIILFAITIIYGGIVSSELRNGTVLLILTKPLTRGAFVIVKAAVSCAFVVALLVAGTLLTWAVTAAIFGTAPAGPLWSAATIWLVLAILYVALMTFLSVAIGSAAGASGAGIGAFALLSIAAIWKPLNDYSPAGLAGQAASLAAHADTPSSLWPVVSSLAVSVLLVWGAVTLFRKKEL